MIWTDEDKAVAAGMKRAGMTAKQIAARMGTTVGDVQRQCRKVKAFSRLDHLGGSAKVRRPRTYATLEELDMK